VNFCLIFAARLLLNTGGDFTLPLRRHKCAFDVGGNGKNASMVLNEIEQPAPFTAATITVWFAHVWEACRADIADSLSVERSGSEEPAGRTSGAAHGSNHIEIGWRNRGA
jgi:hypothetical protein